MGLWAVRIPNGLECRRRRGRQRDQGAVMQAQFGCKDQRLAAAQPLCGWQQDLFFQADVPEQKLFRVHSSLEV